MSRRLGPDERAVTTTLRRKPKFARRRSSPTLAAERFESMAGTVVFAIAIPCRRVATRCPHEIGGTEMATNWEPFFSNWAAPPGQTEIDERDRTEKQIRNALQAWPAVARRNFRVYVKGSYRSGTNVRRGSDLDLAVELLGGSRSSESFIVEKLFEAEHLSDSELLLSPAPPEYGEAIRSFKDDCQNALVAALGLPNVQRHNKCITVSEKSTTLPADVVPCLTHRRYDDRITHHDGIEIRPDHGHSIVNWPRQDYDNGVSKNERTSRRYKRVVRGLKALENLMAEAGNPETASWLIECLVYNVPDTEFRSPSNYENALSILLWLDQSLSATVGSGSRLEVNELKYLFAGSQAWTLAEALGFVKRALQAIRA